MMGQIVQQPPTKTKVVSSISIRELGLSVFVLFAFGTGILAHLLPAVYPYTKQITDVLLLVINAMVFMVIYQRNRDNRLLTWALTTIVATFFIEAIGVATGLVFGSYGYGDTLKWQWLGVPFVIALNWTVLILATNMLAGVFTNQAVKKSILAGIFIVSFDYLVEPVAIALNYWQWDAIDIPEQNYLAWLFIGFLFSLPLNYLKIRYQSLVLLAYLMAQILFFAALGVFL